MAFLEQFVISPMLIALIIPVVYAFLRKKNELKNVLIIIGASVGAILLYPLVSLLSGNIPYIGYTIGKFIIFVFIPLLAVYYIERWDFKKIFKNLGIRKENISKSIIYGILVALLTISGFIIGVFLNFITIQAFDFVFSSIMFVEAFTEEFFFRGFLFLYLMRKTNLKVAFITSVLAFLLAHPQHFVAYMLIPTILQGTLLTIVTYKTKNIIGPWISHGMNRFFAVLISGLLGLIS